MRSACKVVTKSSLKTKKAKTKVCHPTRFHASFFLSFWIHSWQGYVPHRASAVSTSPSPFLSGLLFSHTACADDVSRLPMLVIVALTHNCTLGTGSAVLCTLEISLIDTASFCVWGLSLARARCFLFFLFVPNLGHVQRALSFPLRLSRNAESFFSFRVFLPSCCDVLVLISSVHFNCL